MFFKSIFISVQHKYKKNLAYCCIDCKNVWAGLGFFAKMLSCQRLILIIWGESALEVEHENYAFILPVDEKYWNRLCQRRSAQTHVFIPKSQVAPLQAEKLLFYVIGAENKQVLGVADFLERITGDYLDLWEKFGGESCFESFEEYKAFASGKETLIYIRFTNFRQLSEPKPSEEVAEILGPLHRFNVIRYLDKESALRLM